MSRLDIKKHEWNHELPQLQRERTNCSACYLEGNLYVVGGLKTNSIEKLDTLKADSSWEVIEIPEQTFSPRYWSGVGILNKHEIAILGGRGRVGNSHRGSSEIFVLDTLTETLKKESESDTNLVARNN